jgi:2-polyprenyl-6-methoxyphenol hydroxylase-like FAD-dependent oxidoreductase
MPTQASQSDSVQLLVVGAGPVGLFAALTASRLGIRVRVIDQVWRGYAPGHATLLHASSLELLEEAGIASRMRAAGHEVRELSVHVGDAPVLELELPAPVLAVPQGILEEALVTAIRRENVELLTPYQAVTIEQESSHVDVRVLRRALVTLGSPAHYSEWEPLDSSVIRASFVIGADGYESRVRAALGIEPVGMGSTETFAVFEAEGDAPQAESTMHLCFDDESSGVMLPLADGRKRWAFQVRDALDAEPDLGRLRSLQSQRAPWCTDTPDTVSWGSVIQFERRLVRQLGKHRVWLAGDAAHVTSPLGNQSMNAGLVEAHELAHCVARAVDSPRGLAELEDCGTERVREWHKLFGVNVGFETLPHAPKWLAKYARRLVPTLPVSSVDATLFERLGLRLS